MIWYDIFIYCNWDSTRWQWSVSLSKNKKETAQKEKQCTKIFKNKIQTIKRIHNKNKHKKIIIKYKSSNWKVTEKQIIMTQLTAITYIQLHNYK
jgi:hypothetical protein